MRAKLGSRWIRERGRRAHHSLIDCGVSLAGPAEPKQRLLANPHVSGVNASRWWFVLGNDVKEPMDQGHVAPCRRARNSVRGDVGLAVSALRRAPDAARQ